MNKNQTWKVVIIVAAVLIFVYGIFGVPAGFSGDALANALISPSAMRHGINLGLDLKGGTHLILQVQVNDAVNFETDNAMESLKAAFKSVKITYSEITKPDPNNHPEQIVIKGVAPESRSQLQESVQAKLADYDLSPGTENTWTVTLRPQALNTLKDGAVDQAIETIRSRIDELGVNEPIIERHGLGQYQILVQLPGVDDPARVKEIMQSTAMLEIKLVLGGPYGSEQEARQAHQNDDSLVLQGSAANRSSSDSGEEWYAVTRTSVVTGRDMRQQGASPGRHVQPDERGRPKVCAVYRRTHWRQTRGYPEQESAGSGHDSVANSRSGQDNRRLHRAERERSCICFKLRCTSGGNHLSRGADGWAVARSRFHPRRCSGRHRRNGCGPRLHVDLLPRRRHQRGCRAGPEFDHSAWRAWLYRRHFDVARNCRRHSDRSHGW